jgi:hypothetical protein
MTAHMFGFLALHATHYARQASSVPRRFGRPPMWPRQRRRPTGRPGGVVLPMDGHPEANMGRLMIINAGLRTDDGPMLHVCRGNHEAEPVDLG